MTDTSEEQLCWHGVNGGLSCNSAPAIQNHSEGQLPYILRKFPNAIIRAPRTSSRFCKPR